MITIFFGLILSLTINADSALDLKWESYSDPSIMSSYYIKNFYQLPLEGKVSSKTRFWSGPYWPFKKGSINFRWYAKNKIGFQLNSPQRQNIHKMTIPELAELSPAEKYDLLLGKYDYPLTKAVNTMADPNAYIWEGICHGWSPASMNHNEPTPKLLRNPDGIEIPFGSSDIKALLSYYYAYLFRAPYTYQMGRRCYNQWEEKNCSEDLNAGAFHIVLANRVGFEGKSFIADIQRFKEVWNHPIVDYQTFVLREQFLGTKATKKISVKTILNVVDENDSNWQPILGTKGQKLITLNYQYDLHVNQNGEIIGGKWTSKERPDFIWLMEKPRKFEGILYRLGDLLND